ncbi:MAG: NAD-dependent epimerase/dehydratase family protein [Actinobacteria bacterium]|nr:NAD-dependent epimerase/dehydratase family protein [Actinomycetota bacterium]
MEVFVTGATGFLGGRLARRLRERGDEVVALARAPAKAGDLQELGVRLVDGDLSDRAKLARAMEGCDAVFHLAGIYKVGIPGRDCPEMHEANVAGTEHVLEAAIEVGVARIVHVSTIGYFGNTHGRILKEGDPRPDGESFLSCYDETKYYAHEIAKQRMAEGAPILIAQPGGAYGPGDHSSLGNVIEQTRKGRMKALTFPEMGFNFGHVDDIVQGLLLINDKGRVGETYILGGELSTARELIGKVAALSGRKPPRITIPGPILKMAIPLGPLVGKFFGTPNLREAIRSVDGVTYWATHEKASRELGYSPRDLDTGLRDTLAELGRPT